MGRRERDAVASRESARGDGETPQAPARVDGETPLAPARVAGGGLDCSLCCEPLRLTALGPCGHSGACATCELRRRVLYKKRDCQLCRAPLDQLIIARHPAAGGAPLDFAALLDGRQCEYDKEWAVTFAQRADRAATRAALVEPRCATCAAGPFGSLEGLCAHTHSSHGLEYCAVCLAGAPRFLSEHVPMTPAALRAHAPDHPQCALCPGLRLFDAEALEKHMADAHWRCTLCEQAEARRAREAGVAPAPRRDFATRAELCAHNRAAHFVCTKGECAAGEGLFVFGSELELRAHEREAHLAPSASRWQRQQASLLTTNFTVGASRDRAAGASGAAAGRGGAGGAGPSDGGGASNLGGSHATGRETTAPTARGSALRAASLAADGLPISFRIGGGGDDDDDERGRARGSGSVSGAGGSSSASAALPAVDQADAPPCPEGPAPRPGRKPQRFGWASTAQAQQQVQQQRAQMLSRFAPPPPPPPSRPPAQPASAAGSQSSRQPAADGLTAAARKNAARRDKRRAGQAQGQTGATEDADE